MKRNCKNTNQKEFRVEKVIKRKGDAKATITLLKVGLIKKTQYKYFPKSERVNIFQN